jgi:hypothetical protein
MARRNRSYLEHGIAATSSRWRDAETAPTLDQRSAVARAIVLRRDKMLKEFGGKAISDKARMLINVAVTMKCFETTRRSVSWISECRGRHALPSRENTTGSMSRSPGR